MGTSSLQVTQAQLRRPLTVKRFNPLEARGEHGKWVHLGEVNPADIRFTDGKIKHGPSGMVIATAAHEKISPGVVKHTVSHVDGTQVYAGTSKKAALQAIADHHNAISHGNQSPEDTASAVVRAIPVRTVDSKNLSNDDAQRTRNALMLSAHLVLSAVKTIKSVDFKFMPQSKRGSFNADDKSAITIHHAIRDPDADSWQRVSSMTGLRVPAGGADALTYVVTHEVGHAVARHVFGKWRGYSGTYDEVDPVFHTQLAKLMHLRKPPDDRLGKTLVSWLNYGKNKNRAAWAVSEYGATRVTELFAELWAEYVLSPSPRPPAQFYGDYVLKRVASMGNG